MGHVVAALREHASLCGRALALWVPVSAAELAQSGWPRRFPGLAGAHPAFGMRTGPPDGGVRETGVRVRELGDGLGAGLWSAQAVRQPSEAGCPHVGEIFALACVSYPIPWAASGSNYVLNKKVVNKYCLEAYTRLG